MRGPLINNNNDNKLELTDAHLHAHFHYIPRLDFSDQLILLVRSSREDKQSTKGEHMDFKLKKRKKWNSKHISNIIKNIYISSTI